MPLQIEHEGKTINVYTETEHKELLDAEVVALKVTNDNLKTEKTKALEKAREASEQKLAAEEAAAKAQGNTDELKRISEQREQEAMAKLNEFKSAIQAEKVTNMINKVTDAVGASGQKKEDLEVLIKARYEFGYDMDAHTATVRGDGVSSVDDVIRHIKESGRYDAYLPGDGSTGGGSQGNNGAGASTKTFDQYTSTELVALKRTDPAAYDKLRSTASHLN